jgi:hypothetical protein
MHPSKILSTAPFGRHLIAVAWQIAGMYIITRKRERERKRCGFMKKNTKQTLPKIFR